MPELPEVQTTVNGLNKTVKGRTIKSVWTDYGGSTSPSAKSSVGHGKIHKESIKNPEYFKKFTKLVSGAKILRARRRAKNILIDLSNGETILIHMKMTGHLMYGRYKHLKKDNRWLPVDKGPLEDPYNRFIHLVFILDNGKHLVFSDTRKFGKVSVIETEVEHDSVHLRSIGPEPLDKSFTYAVFKDRLLKRPNGKIKSVLMDQTLIAGIGNIYSDEILWRSGIHPLSIVSKIPEERLRPAYKGTLETLQKGIYFGGDSMSDYRNIYGERGTFQTAHNVYRLKGTKCKKRGCAGIIERSVVGGRSTHFCPVHQTLYK